MQYYVGGSWHRVKPSLPWSSFQDWWVYSVSISIMEREEQFMGKFYSYSYKHFLFDFDNQQDFCQIPKRCSSKHQSESLLRQLRKWAKWNLVRRNMARLSGIYYGPMRRFYIGLSTNKRPVFQAFIAQSCGENCAMWCDVDERRMWSAYFWNPIVIREPWSLSLNRSL